MKHQRLSQFKEVLRTLKTSKSSIKEAREWVFRRPHITVSKEFIDAIIGSCRQNEANLESVLYLVNDCVIVSHKMHADKKNVAVKYGDAWSNYFSVLFETIGELAPDEASKVRMRTNTMLLSEGEGKWAFGNDAKRFLRTGWQKIT